MQIRLSQESDEGKYECVAENDAGVAYSYGANLYVRGMLSLIVLTLLKLFACTNTTDITIVHDNGLYCTTTLVLTLLQTSVVVVVGQHYE